MALTPIQKLATPEPFYCVGMWYEDFEQTSDTDVRELLAKFDADRVKATVAGQ